MTRPMINGMLNTRVRNCWYSLEYCWRARLGYLMGIVLGMALCWIVFWLVGIDVVEVLND